MPKHVISLLALTMYWLLFCLSVALAASVGTNYEPMLNFKKTYEYKYEGEVNVGHDIPDIARSGVKLQCNFKITGVSLQTFLLQISSVTFEDFNGMPGKNSFKAAPNISKRLAAELSKPFVFEYTKGQVSNIKTSSEVSDTIVNIVRGILSFLHVTVKTTQLVYELNEVGIYGVCHSAYSIEENTEAKELHVTQNVDINNCSPKAELYYGMALTKESKISKERGDNVVGTVKYAYTIKSIGSGGLITKASAQERHYFTPFNVKGGNSKLNAKWDIVLLKETDIAGKPETGQVKSRGNLMYQTEKGLGIMPILMINLTNPVPKIVDLIKRLAQANMKEMSGATSAEVLNLIQLLRASAYEDLELLWKQLSGNDDHRRWLLDTVVEVADERVLKFLKNRLRTEDISVFEAGQALLVAINHLSAEPVLVAMAKEFLTIPFIKSHALLWRTVVLSYGSMVYRVCAQVNPCPVTAVQPLLDIANNGLSNGIDEDTVLALKALGNAGHPSSLKTIMKFLPGFSIKADTLPARVQIMAMQALRHLATRDPHNVQDIALTIFAQRNAPAEIRMLASDVLLKTQPSIALISAMTELLLQETDVQVAGFTYSQLKSISVSHTPDNHYLSTACNVAVKILAPKFGRLGYRYSKFQRLDWFNDNLLGGTSSEFYLLRNGTNAIPSLIISNGKLYFIGKILDIFELGVQTEGLKELFTDRSGITMDFGAANFAAVMKKLSDWQSLPKDKSLLSVYARIFGQEISFLDLKQDVIQNIMKFVSLTASKENHLWNIVQQLQKGLLWHWTKPYLIFETRFIQPTCLGLPFEISKYYTSLAAITVNAKSVINPPLKENLRELINADISLETDGFVGVAKDFFVFHGINTNLFQCGSQLNVKATTFLPWKFNLKKNVKENNYEIIIPPCKKETEVFNFKSDIYAVSRNIDDPLSAKMTPIIEEFVDTEQSFIHKKESYSYKDNQLESSVIYHPKLKYCLETSIYGVTICTHLEAKRIQNHKEHPLSYFLGYTHLACQLEPVKPVKPVEKIKIQINAGPHKHISHGSNMMADSQEKAEGVDPVPDPVITVKMLALSPNEKPLGYECAAYYTPDRQKDEMELIISELAEEANWKICLDANIDNMQTGVKGHFKWGAECQSYEVALKLSATDITGPKPTVTAELNWAEVPAFIQMFGKRIWEYLPGVSYVWGFSQKHEKNIEREVLATLLVSAQKGYDINIKVPELTVSREGLASPFEIWGIEIAEEN